MRHPLRRALTASLLGLAGCALLAPIAFAQTPATAGKRAAPAWETAILAGGCFWTLQKVFDGVDGVVGSEVGFTGGSTPDPSYEQVKTGRTGHVEAVRLTLDPARVSFARLLDIYWRAIDPTRSDQQFCDVGRQYNAVVFTLNDAQRAAAEASRAALERSKPFRAAIVTPIRPAGSFHRAEEEHQRFWEQSAGRYAQYERLCQRERRLEALWGPAVR